MRQIAEHAAPRSLRGPNQPLARLIGADTVVPCADGRARRYVNLDYAASTPVMAAVWDAVEAFVPWYSSVHRGSGLKSQRLDRRVRGRARRRRRVRRRPCRRRGRLRPQHDRGDQRPVGRAAPGRSRALERGRASLQHASLAAPRSPAAPVHRLAGRAAGCVRARASARRGRGSTWSPSPAPRTSPGRCGRSPSSPSLPTLMGRSCSSTPRSSRPPRRIDMARRGHRLPGALGPQALRAVRSRRAGGRRVAGSASASRCCMAAERSSSSRWTTSSGRTPPRAMRPARRTSWEPWRSPPPAAPCSTSGWTPSPRTNGRSRHACGARCRTSRDCDRLTLWPDDGRPRRRRHLQSRRLPTSAAGRHPQRRARDRRPPRLLLRAPAHRRGCSAYRTRARPPRGRAARGTASRAPGSRAGQPRARHHARRHRPPDRRPARDRHHGPEIALRAPGRSRRVPARADAEPGVDLRA